MEIFGHPIYITKAGLDTVQESDDLKISDPKQNQTFLTELGKSKKEITVTGSINNSLKGKILVIVKTDWDYPQALGKAEKDGHWSFSGVTLGGVDHLIYAVLVDQNDSPVFRSQAIKVRLERK